MKRRRILLDVIVPNGSSLITFYLEQSNGELIQCTAENGMRFCDWILSDYFDTTNPYNINIPGVNDIQDFLKSYGDTEDLSLYYGVGCVYKPFIGTLDIIIPNQVYEVNCSSFGY